MELFEQYKTHPFTNNTCINIKHTIHCHSYSETQQIYPVFIHKNSFIALICDPHQLWFIQCSTYVHIFWNNILHFIRRTLEKCSWLFQASDCIGSIESLKSASIFTMGSGKRESHNETSIPLQNPQFSNLKKCCLEYCRFLNFSDHLSSQFGYVWRSLCLISRVSCLAFYFHICKQALCVYLFLFMYRMLCSKWLCKPIGLGQVVTSFCMTKMYVQMALSL